MEIIIDYSRDGLLDEYAKSILKERYMLPTEKSPQDAFARAAITYASNPQHAQRIYEYASNLWFMFATPILSNGGTNKGMPISCFLSFVGDSRKEIADHYSENIWLASSGGGIGSYWGSLRSTGARTSSGNFSTGVTPFIKVVDSQMLAFSQGSTRRGSYAAYLDISHPEIEEFVSIRKPTGGDANRRSLNLHHGINITNQFMEQLGDCIKDSNASTNWCLIDPHSKEVVKTVNILELWESILLTRVETGEPYIHFIDTTHELQPEVHKTLGLRVHGSNLCSEIVLPTNEQRTAVCCLSSVNLEYYDEWRDTDMVGDIIEYLDNVLSYFITNAPKGMEKAVYSASQERSLGLGAMGFHAYLQRHGIPFESAMAVTKNRQMFSNIANKANERSVALSYKGVAPDFSEADIIDKTPYSLKGRRNVHLLAIAPNASSSILCGNTSPSVEPFRANAYRQDTLSGSYTSKNKYLNAILSQKIYDNYSPLHQEVMDEVMAEKLAEYWKSIVNNEGSCQHLDILTDDEKDVFKTAIEIDQHWIIEHAGHRQNYIDQAQSINLFFPPDVDKSYLHSVHWKAWKNKLKTLYYCRSDSINKAENVSIRFDRYDHDNSECIACEG